MLIQFQIVLVLVLVLENSFQPHRRNFVRLCQAEWMLTTRKSPVLEKNGAAGRQFVRWGKRSLRRERLDVINGAILWWITVPVQLTMPFVEQDDLSLDLIEAALRDGSLESADKTTLNRYLRATHGIQKGQNSAFHVRLDQASQTLRNLIVLADTGESKKASTAREDLKFRLQTSIAILGLLAVLGGLGYKVWCDNHPVLSTQESKDLSPLSTPLPAPVSNAVSSSPSETNSQTKP